MRELHVVNILQKGGGGGIKQLSADQYPLY